MDNKTIFVRTSKGEDEMHSRTTHLPGDIKRALLMVDGNATFGEISKRAAPSLRASLNEMFEELEKGGFIQDKDQGRTPDKAKGKAEDKARQDNIPKMSVPVKIATPHKSKPVDEDAGELDFMSGFTSHPQASEAAAEAAAAEDAKAAAEAAMAQRFKAEAEEKSRREMEAAKLSAQREAEAILHKAEHEAARIREETVRRAKVEAEATRIKAEQEAQKVRDELAAAKLKAEQETKLRLEAAAKLRQQAEAVRIKAEQEAEQMRIELEAAKIRAELEEKARLEATVKARARMQAEDDAAKAREEAERIARQEQEAAKVREEAERIARREQEATKAREEAERIKYEQRVRDETERIIKQEQEAKAHETAAREQAARAAEEPAEKPSAFAFDSFQVDKPLYTSESHIGKQPAQKEKQPAQKVSSAEAAHEERPAAFAFDSFKVDEPQSPVEPPRNKPPVQQASPAQQSVPVAKTAREGQRPVKQQPVPPSDASKPADGKPSQEQIQRAMQERKAVEERMAGEALEAKKMAEAQAKVWAEAEQRALEAVRAEVEQATRQSTVTVDDTPVAKPAPVERVSRKPFPWGRLVGFVFKLGLFLLVLLVGALFIIPYVMPMRDYMPKAEQLLSAKLQQPVHIGRLSGRILPMPRLEFGEIYIGDAKQFQAENAQINFALTGLFTEAKPVSSIEFQGVKVRGTWLRDVAGWLQQMANENKYPVSRMVISQGKLDADVFELTGVEGELDFNEVGKFTKTNLRADSGKYAMGIQATPEDKLQVTITVRGSAFPLLPNWTFDDLTAKGELNNNELMISDIDARILGGVMQGNASINWRSGWRAQGALTAKKITMQQLNHLLEGNMEGSARFKMTSLDLGGLADSAVLDGSFVSSDGTIGGMDIVETARTRRKENLPGGRTHYDDLAGVVSYASGVYHFKQTKVSGSALTAMATFDVDAAQQQLSGKMKVNLSLPDASGTVDLQIGGVADSPTLRYGQ